MIIKDEIIRNLKELRAELAVSEDTLNAFSSRNPPSWLLEKCTQARALDIAIATMEYVMAGKKEENWLLPKAFVLWLLDPYLEHNKGITKTVVLALLRDRMTDFKVAPEIKEHLYETAENRI